VLRKEQGKAPLPSPFVRILHGTLAQHWNVLAQLNAQGAGVYVTVNQTNLRGRKTENIVRVRCLFLDLDGAPLPHDPPARARERRPAAPARRPRVRGSRRLRLRPEMKDPPRQPRASAA
jgi:hypothetical protein